MDSTSITDGAPLSESLVIQTTVRTPRRSDRRTTTLNIMPQSLEARRRRVGTPRGTNMVAPQNRAANLEAATGSAAGAANPAAGASGLSQPSVWAPPRLRQHYTFALYQVVSQRQGGADLDGRQMDKASETMLTLTYWDNFPVFRQRPG